MKNEVNMEIDMRKHENIRAQVHAGLVALKLQGRQIWGEDKMPLEKIAVRLMVGVGDLARAARDGIPEERPDLGGLDADARLEWRRALKKELGNIVFSTIRWIDDMGLDVLECLDLAIDAQEKFAKSGRPR